MQRAATATTPPASRQAWGMRMRVAIFLLLATAAAARNADAPSIAKEHQLKAAFLYNFTKFVDWPPQRFEKAESPIVIAVLGRNPFDDAVHELARERKVNGRPVKFVQASIVAEAKTAHLVFIAAGEEPRFERAVAELNAAGVLTVGESQRFAAAGGAITFVMEEDKVRFVINLAAAQKAELRVSAQLQKLATRVERGPAAAP